MYNEGFLEKHSFVDFVVKGEYEYSLLALARYLKKDNSLLANVPGLIYKDAKGIIRNNRRVAVDDLDSLPWPARHFLPRDGYEDLPDILPKPTAHMLASRGCPYNCMYCAWPQIMYNSNKYRTRDPKDVAREMEYLVSICGFNSIYFDDDVFNIGKERILKMCYEIKRKKICIPWAMMGRADLSDREDLKAMRDAGLCSIKYGIESADQAIVNNCGKNLNLEKAKENIEIAKSLGLKIHLTFMFGLPGETKKTVKKTIDFALKINPNSLQFSIATPFPGSRYFEILDKRGDILSKNWQDYDGYSQAVIKTDDISGDNLRQTLKNAEKIWKKHLFFRDINKNKSSYFKKALSDPICAAKKLREILF
jgi:anaerobic magnesium-protoporphyrin IX monomethyl ester cyclase